jgi:hypothetical protein
MSAGVLLNGFLLFVILLVIHLLIRWFIRVQREILLLFMLFLLFPLLCFIILTIKSADLSANLTAIAAVYFSLALVYLQTYPILTTEIPSFKILRLVHDQKGITETEIIASLRNDKELFDAKVEELEKDSLVVRRQDNRYELSRPGKILADLFILYRSLLRTQWGKG